MITESMNAARRSSALRGLAVAAATLSVGAGSAPVLGQENRGTVTVDVARCLELETADARLACFGAEVDEAIDERAPADVRGAPAASERVDAETAEAQSAPAARRDTTSATTDSETVPAEEATLSRRERRALRNAEQAAAEDAAEAAAEPAPTAGEFFGTIVEMRERLPNAYVIRLDNGQIWEQTEPKWYPLRPGLDVRIYPTRWGSRYRLTGIGAGGNIQVRRVE